MSVRILHISDLHLQKFISDSGTEVDTWFDTPNYEFQLLNSIEPVEYIVITGDLANSGEKEEYERLEIFLQLLCTKLNVEKSKVILCPGNHDINWKNNKLAYHKFNAHAIENNIAEYPESNAYLFHTEKFLDFKSFYDNFYNDESIKFDPTLAIIRDVPVDIDGTEFSLSTINTCFKESFSKPHYGFIEYSSFLNTIQESSGKLRIAIMHHVPVNEEIANWDDEIKYLCNYHAIKVFLCGHLHVSKTQYIKSNSIEYQEFTIGSIGKKDSNVENTYSILTFSFNNNELAIDKKTWQYFKHENVFSWHKVVENSNVINIKYTSNAEILKEKAEDLFSEEPNFSFPNEVETYAYKLVGLIQKHKLYSSGHFHWNSDTRTLGLIDTHTLLTKRETSLISKGSIYSLFRNNNLNGELIVGLGQEGNILGAFLSSVTGIPFTYIPYHSRRADHVTHERNIKLNGYKSIILIIDVIFSASSVLNIINDDNYCFTEIESITLISLFHISRSPKYHPGMFVKNDKRLSYYTVCDKISISKCPYDHLFNRDCPIFANQLEKVHSLHSIPVNSIS